MEDAERQHKKRPMSFPVYSIDSIVPSLPSVRGAGNLTPEHKRLYLKNGQVQTGHRSITISAATINPRFCAWSVVAQIHYNHRRGPQSPRPQLSSIQHIRSDMMQQVHRSSREGTPRKRIIGKCKTCSTIMAHKAPLIDTVRIIHNFQVSMSALSWNFSSTGVPIEKQSSPLEPDIQAQRRKLRIYWVALITPGEF